MSQSPSVCLFAFLLVCLSVYLPAFLLVCLFVCLSVYLPACSLSYLSVCLSVRLPVCFSTCLSAFSSYASVYLTQTKQRTWRKKHLPGQTNRMPSLIYEKNWPQVLKWLKWEKEDPPMSNDATEHLQTFDKNILHVRFAMTFPTRLYNSILFGGMAVLWPRALKYITTLSNLLQ